MAVLRQAGEHQSCEIPLYVSLGHCFERSDLLLSHLSVCDKVKFSTMMLILNGL